MKIVTFGEVMVRLGVPDYLKLIQTDKFDVSMPANVNFRITA